MIAEKVPAGFWQSFLMNSRIENLVIVLPFSCNAGRWDRRMTFNDVPLDYLRQRVPCVSVTAVTEDPLSEYRDRFRGYFGLPGRCEVRLLGISFER